MKASCYHSLLALAALLNACWVEAQNAPAEYMGVFRTTSSVAIEWAVDDPSMAVYTSEDVFSIENAAANYFGELLSEPGLSAFQSPNRFVDIKVAMRQQIRSGNNLILESVLDIYHVGDSGIADAADLLRFVTNKNTTGFGEFIVLDSLINMNIKVDMISFASAQESVALAGGFPPFYNQESDRETDSKYSQSERTLIVVTSVLSFALFALSSILIWIAGGWLGLRKQIQVLLHREEAISHMTMQKAGIEQQPTKDTDDDGESSPRNLSRNENESQMTSPSGILGVNPYLKSSSAKNFEGLGIKMTPAKKNRPSEMDSVSVMETPMSVYSDTGRAPIGIQSMRKLMANRNEENDGFGGDPYGMKRLDYDA